MKFLVMGIPPGTMVPEVKAEAADEESAKKLKLELAVSHPKGWSWRIVKTSAKLIIIDSVLKESGFMTGLENFVKVNNKGD